MYKYLFVIVNFLISTSIFVKSQSLLISPIGPNNPDSCFCSNYYENSDQCDGSVSQVCYTCGECYNDVNQLELYSLIKPCDSDNIELHVDSTCTSYAGILKDTCSSLNTDTSFTLTSGNCSDLILPNDEIDLAAVCFTGGVCELSTVGIVNCNSNKRCEGRCSVIVGDRCLGGPLVGQDCLTDDDCSTPCFCNGVCPLGGISTCDGGIIPTACLNSDICEAELGCFQPPIGQAFCNGGPNNGELCSNDDECSFTCTCNPLCPISGQCNTVPSTSTCVNDLECTGLCSSFTCIGGPNNGQFCFTNDDCSFLCICDPPCPTVGHCNGGIISTECDNNLNCIAKCSSFPNFICLGGPNGGQPCFDDEDCSFLCVCDPPSPTPPSPPPSPSPPLPSPTPPSPSPSLTLTPTPPSPSPSLPSPPSPSPPSPSPPTPSLSSPTPTTPAPSPTTPTPTLPPSKCQILEESYIGNCECEGVNISTAEHFCDICFSSFLSTFRKLDCDTLLLADYGSDDSCNDLEFEITDNAYPICADGSISCFFNLNSNEQFAISPSTIPDTDKKSINYRLFCNGQEIIGGKDQPTNDINLITINILNIIFYYTF